MTAVNPLYEVIPGLHPDVLVFPALETIAIKYPEIDPEDTILGSQHVFFHYKGAIKRTLDAMAEMVETDGWEIIPANTPLGQLSPLRFEKTHLIVLINGAWTEALKRNPSYKPLYTKFPQFWYENFSMYGRWQEVGGASGWTDPVTGYLYLGTTTFYPGYPERGRHLGDNINDYSKTAYENITAASPLSSFPPLSLYNPLEEVFFFERSKSSHYFGKYLNWYGPLIGSTIHGHMIRQNRDVLLSEIIHQKDNDPNGYSVEIDREAMGLGTIKPGNIVIDTSDAGTEEYLKRVSYWIGDKYEFNTNLFPVNEYKFNDIHFRNRDRWIRRWYMGKKVPIIEEEVGIYKLTGETVQEIGFLPARDNDIQQYDLTIKPSSRSLTDFIKPISIIISSAVQIYTGNTSALFNTFKTVMQDFIARAISGMPGSELKLGMSMLVSSIIAELPAGGRGPQAEQTAYSTVLGLMSSKGNAELKGMLMNAVSKAELEAEMSYNVSLINAGITEDEKTILSATVNYHLPALVVDLSTMAQQIDLGPAFHALPSGVPQQINIPSQRSESKIPTVAIVAAGAAILLLVRKK